MKHDTALTVCPDYLPANVERLPFYDGSVSTPEENKAVFSNLWSRGAALISGDMRMDYESVGLTVDNDRNIVQARIVQSAFRPECGFDLRLNDATQSSRQHMRIEIAKIQAEVERTWYVRHIFDIYQDGYAVCESLRQGISARKLISEEAGHAFKETHQLTTDELNILDNLYVFIGTQNEIRTEKDSHLRQRKGRLAQYVGRRLRHCWYFLAG